MVVEMEDPARADSDVGQPQLAFRVAELDLSLGTVQDVVDNLESADWRNFNKHGVRFTSAIWSYQKIACVSDRRSEPITLC